MTETLSREIADLGRVRLPTVASGAGGWVSLEWLFTRNKILIPGGQVIR